MADFDPHKLFAFTPIVDRKPITWPNGAHIAVWVVPNVESYHIDVAQQGPAPDIRNYSRRSYGNRVGVWRLMETLSKHGVRGSVALNGEIAVHYPRIMEAMLKLGWEMMGHGVTNSRIMTGLTREQETAVITETKTMIEKWGVKMRGWLGPGLTETYDSTELLKAAGVDYTCDWVNDDLPYRMKSGLYSVPYTLELNDQPLFNMPSITTEEYQRRICEAFDVLYAEGKGRGRVMCIALHPHLMGAPHRIRYLDRALGYIASHSGVWFATGSEILDAYKAQEPNV